MEPRTNSPFPRIDRLTLAIIGVLLVLSCALFFASDRDHDWRYYQSAFKDQAPQKLRHRAAPSFAVHGPETAEQRRRKQKQLTEAQIADDEIALVERFDHADDTRHQGDKTHYQAGADYVTPIHSGHDLNPLRLSCRPDARR